MVGEQATIQRLEMGRSWLHSYLYLYLTCVCTCDAKDVMIVNSPISEED